MMGSDRADAWALAFAMAFLSGWADVLCVARYQTFVGQLTGNVIYFGLSLAPPARRRDAGVTDDPALYLCVIVANIAGAGLFQFLKRSSDRPGAALAVLSVLSMLAGDLVFALVSRSPWCALFFAPCFGALNALSSGPPLSTSVVTVRVEIVGQSAT